MPTLTKGEIAPLSAERKKSLRLLVYVILVIAAIFAGVNIALKPIALAPYPGTKSDPLMRTLGYTVWIALLATAFKIGELRLMGNYLERKLGTHRPVRLRQVFHPAIRQAAIWGGMLQMIYVILFISLVTILAPTALAAARACVVLALIPVEMLFGIIPRKCRRLNWLLARSALVTLAGACIVIFADGFDLFTGMGGYLWVFLALIILGNLSIAFAEVAENKGVHKAEVAAGTYTLARFVYYSLTCIVAVVAWGLLSGSWDVLWNTFRMCWERWYWMIPIAVIAGLVDLTRICVKPVVSATFMYIVMSLSVAIDAITQTVAKHIAPQYYMHVSVSWHFVLLCLIGGAVITWGAKLYPHKEVGEAAAKMVAEAPMIK